MTQERGQREPSIDDLLELPYPVETSIAPNGQRVVFEIGTPDWRRNQHVSQLWLTTLDADGHPDAARQLTFARHSSYSARWSPNGQWLAFLSQRDGDQRPQLYRLSPFGGEAERLTEVAELIETFEWSPDGRSIAYLAVESESDADRARRRRYGAFVVQNEDYRHKHLWHLSLEERRRRQLTRGQQLHVVDFEWSPDGKRIAVTAASTPQIEHLEDSRIYLLNPEDRSLSALTEAGFHTPRWSPDGRQLASLHHGGAYYETNELWLFDVAKRRGRAVPSRFDEDKQLLAWTADGLYFHAVLRTSEHLFRLSPASGEVTQITPAGDHGLCGREFHFDAQGRRVTFINADGSRVDEVVLLHLDRGELEYLTNIQEQAAEWGLHPPELFSWKSDDGTEIEGVLYKPADFDPNRRYPLLVVLHGGPAGTAYLQLLPYENRRYYPVHKWVQRDALVLMPNYRGSAGYGASFRALNVRNLGLGDYADVISGVDALIARGWVDTERVGAMGWSQGGYIAAFISTYSDRFCAVSVGAGISNWITYYVNTDVHPFTRHYLQATPWEERDIYDKTSPMTYINRAQTPTLIQHGERDQRVPLANAYELHQGLHDVGVEAKLVVYSGMPHVITRPRQNRQVMEENWRWFNRFIWKEQEARPLGRTCYVALPDEERVREVARLAEHDAVDFRVLTGRWGLVTPEDVDLEEDAESLDQVQIQRCISRIIEQIGGAGWKEFYLYNGAPDMTSVHLVYVGILLVAAGSVGDISVEHAVVDPDDA